MPGLPRAARPAAGHRPPLPILLAIPPEASMRLLHTMLRVGDLQRSLDFYTGVLGMRVLRKKDYPEGRFTLAFVGYGDEADTAVIELTHNWDTKAYELGTGFGHLAVAVPD